MSIGGREQELGIYAGIPTIDAESILQKYWCQEPSTRRMKHEKLEDKLNNLR